MSSAQFVLSKANMKVIKKTFSRLGKLLDALSNDMATELPAAVGVQEVTPKLLDSISKKISHTITKYVIIVCQESTLDVIETHTGYLLDDLRQMCTALRSLLPIAGPSMKERIVEVGRSVLLQIRTLTEDISQYIEHLHKSKTVPNENFLETQTTLGSLTARVWSTSELISKIPLNNWTAVGAKVLPLSETITDAYAELQEIVETEEVYPVEEDPAINDLANQAGQLSLGGLDDDEDDEDEELDGEDLLGDCDDDEDGELLDEDFDEDEDYDEDDDDLDFNDKELSKLEYRWVNPCLHLIKFSSEIASRVSDLLQKMTPPENSAYSIPRTQLFAEQNLTSKDPTLEADRNAVISFDKECELIRKYLNTVSDHVDRVGNALYSPQSIVNAARSSYMIITHLVKIIDWIAVRDAEGWFAPIHRAAEKAKAKRDRKRQLNPLEVVDEAPKKTKAPKAEKTVDEVVQKHMAIFTGEQSIRPEVQQLETSYRISIETARNLPPYYADPIVTRGATKDSKEVAGVWPWISECKGKLQKIYSREPSLYLMYVKVFRAGDVLGEDSDEEAEIEAKEAEDDPDEIYVSEDHADYDIENDEGVIIY